MNFKTFFFPLSLIIAVFVVIWFIIPTWNDVQEKSGELGKLNETISTLESKIGKVNEEMADYDQQTERALIAYDALPEKINNNHLINELFTGAKEYGLLISSINTKDAKPDVKTRTSAMISGPGFSDKDKNETAAVTNPPVFSLPVDIELLGSYKSLKDFVGFVESAKRLLIVDNIEITEADKEEASGSGSISASISTTAFYKKEVENLSFSSVVYDDDKVLNSILQKGLPFEYLDNYKNNIESTVPDYSPDLSGVGKEDLFSRAGVVAVEESAEEGEGGVADDLDQQDASDVPVDDIEE